MKPILDNIRWGELLGFVLTPPSALWVALGEVARVPREDRTGIVVGFALALLAAFLRNPKALAWVAPKATSTIVNRQSEIDALAAALADLVARQRASGNQP